jgi:Tol biopolymer transport system component
MSMLKIPRYIPSFIAFAAIILYAGCSSRQADNTMFQPIAYPTPTPDTVSKIFLPGIVSIDGLDFNACFSPDGKTFYFSRSRNRKYVIMECRYEQNKWSAANPSPLFDTSFSNTDPFIAGDGSLYFISNRPKDNNDSTDDYDIYRMSREGDSYATPENIPGVNSDSTEYYVSVAASGNIYFGSYREGQLDLFVSKKNISRYETPVNLGPVVNSSGNEHDPLIAPDESFLIFTSDRPGGLGESDLYIARSKDGKWQTPVNMGREINTSTYDYCPYLTPDGAYLFYSSDFEVKWISSRILKSY